MSQNELDETEIARLLASAVSNGSHQMPGRSDLLSTLISELEHRSAQPTLVVGDDLVIIEDAEVRPRRSRPVVLGAIAAAVLVVAGLTAHFASIGSEPPSVEVAVDGQQRLVPAKPLPAPIAAGVHQTDVIGSGVELRLPPGFEVIEEEDGRLLLGRSGDPMVPRSTITMVEAAGAPELETLIDRLVESGSITAIATVDMTTQGMVRTWELRLTNEGVAECVGAGPCLPLGPVSLWASGVNLVTEVVTPDGQRVWWVEQSAVHLDPFLEDGSAVLGTLEFG